jgi:hypothetical protein
LIDRPTNHVTQQLALRLHQAGAPCPDLTEQQLAYLEALFPPRCLKPNEMVEDHLRYAGKVELIAMLRAQLEERTGGDEHLDPTLMPADLASA